MTGSDMVYNFQQMLESISPTYKETDRLNTWEILSYLNRTVDRYIKMKYLSGRTFQENVFKVASSPDDLAKLYTTASVVPTDLKAAGFVTDIAEGIQHAYVIDVDDPDPANTTHNKLLYYIRSDSKVTRTLPFVVTDEWVPNREIDYNQIDPIITTPFNKPILEYPLVTMLNGDQYDSLGAAEVPAVLLLITDSYTTAVSKCSVTFLRQPIPIDMDGTNNCELGIHIHEEIVKMAVSMYMDEYKLKLAQKA